MLVFTLVNREEAQRAKFAADVEVEPRGKHNIFKAIH